MSKKSPRSTFQTSSSSKSDSQKVISASSLKSLTSSSIRTNSSEKQQLKKPDSKKELDLSSSSLEDGAQGQFENKVDKLGLDQLEEVEDGPDTSQRYSKKDWQQIIKKKNRNTISYSELKSNIRLGIPKIQRPRIWVWLADMKKLKAQYEKGIYLRLANHINAAWEDQLKKDVNNAILDSPFFLGENSLGKKQLFRIMNAFCNIEPSRTGYSIKSFQVASTILITMNDPSLLKYPIQSFGVADVIPEMQEEWAFWIFFHIMQEKNQNQLYQPNMMKKYSLIDSLISKISEHSPQILAKFEEEELKIDSILDDELFSLLSIKTPLSLAQFTLDMFLLDGHPALIDIMSQMILLSKKEILESNDGPELLQFIKTQKNLKVWKQYSKMPYVLIPFQCVSMKMKEAEDED